MTLTTRPTYEALTIARNAISRANRSDGREALNAALVLLAGEGYSERALIVDALRKLNDPNETITYLVRYFEDVVAGLTKIDAVEALSESCVLDMLDARDMTDDFTFALMRRLADCEAERGGQYVVYTTPTLNGMLFAMCSTVAACRDGVAGRVVYTSEMGG